MVERVINIKALKQQFEDHFVGSDEVHLIEPLLLSILKSEVTVVKTFENDEAPERVLTLEEILQEMKTCKPFWIYKEDIELKNDFFTAFDNLDSWQCYANEPERQVYTKHEPGKPLVSLFFRFKAPINMFYPIALIS